MNRPALALLSLLLVACGTRTDEASAVIGPEGGTLAVTDSRSALYGVRVDVPPGALAARSVVTVRPRADASALPSLPTGLAAFEPVLELTSAEPFRQDVTIAFPLRSTALRQTQVLSAFRADAAARTWRVVLVAALEDQAFTIRTRETGTWRWGVTLLETVGYETLKPAMEGLRGPQAWAEAEAAARGAFERHLATLRETDAWTNCDSLNLFARFLLDMRDDTKRSIEQTLATSCGGCTVTADVFLGELIDYVRAKVRKELVNYIIDACDPGFLLGLYLKLEAAIYFENVIDQLSCDYDCLVKTPPPGLWGQVATYGVCDIALIIVAIGADYADCHLAP